MRSPFASRWSAVAVLVFGVLLAVLPATAASAHAAILGTDPSSGAVVNASPSHVSVKFSEQVSLTTRSISVVAPDGSAVARGPAQRSDGGRALTQPLQPNLRHGTYVASFRIISADGHPVSGGFSFSVVEPSKPATAVRGNGEAKVEGLVRDAVWVGRYAGYAGAALLVGALVIGVAMRSKPRRKLNVTVLATVGGGVALAGTFLSFVCQVPYAYGGSFADISRSELADVADSTVGRAYLARLALLAFVVAWLRLAYRSEFVAGPSRWRDAILGLAGVATVLTWPFAGHAATSRLWQLSVLSDALHVASALVWLGGLVVLTIAMVSRTRVATFGPVLDLWSKWALWAVAVLGLTGVTQALLRLDRTGDLWHTRYGILLLWKAAGLVSAVAAAAGSRYWLRQRSVDRGAADRRRSVSWLRRTIVVEVAIVAAVLAVTVVLVGTPPPQERAHASGPPAFYSATVNSNGMVLQIEVNPARVGNNSVHLTAFTPAGAPLHVQQWDVTAALPARSIGPVTVPLLPISANHVVGEAALSLPGTWQLNVTVRTSDVDQVTVSRSFEVP